MKICLVIINYNGINYLSVYLDNIAEFCSANGIYLLITDDCSTDGSCDYLEKGNYNYCVNNSGKHGFAANVNNGLRYAQTIDNFDYFIVSNNDVELRQALFEPLKSALISIAEKDTKVGLIGFDEINPDRYSYFEEFNFSIYTTEAIQVVTHIPGFFFIISSNLLKEIHYMDEEYFMYGEDNDYFARTKKAGYSIYNTFLPVMHFSEGSSSDSKKTSWYVYRNALLYAQKHLGFIGCMKMLLSLVNQIYNPFKKASDPSSYRIKRNGFFYNHYLLLKSIYWNILYYIKQQNLRKLK